MTRGFDYPDGHAGIAFSGGIKMRPAVDSAEGQVPGPEP